MQRSLWNGVCRWRNPMLHPHRCWAQFHSTPPSFAKRTGKLAEGTSGRPSKNYIRFSVRQKRADAKRALNDFLLKGSYTKKSVQDEWQALYTASKRSQYVNVEDCQNDSYDHAQSNHSRRCKSKRTPSKKSKKNQNKWKKWMFVSDAEEIDHETTFEATFGDRCYMRSFRSWADFSPQDPITGFKWRDDTYWSNKGNNSRGYREQRESSSAENNRRRGWESESDFDYEEEQAETEISLGSSSHRVILGLPPTGLLKIDDIKTAFRSSALKWHPDKHQGPSQAMAGEKFKLCVEAYNSLCSSLRSTL